MTKNKDRGANRCSYSTLTPDPFSAEPFVTILEVFTDYHMTKALEASKSDMQVTSCLQRQPKSPSQLFCMQAPGVTPESVSTALLREVESS